MSDFRIKEEFSRVRSINTKPIFYCNKKMQFCLGVLLHFSVWKLQESVGCDFKHFAAFSVKSH